MKAFLILYSRRLLILFQWEVASGVLQIFVKLLEQFEPSSENISEEYIEINGRERVTAAKSPGYTLMVHMLNETPMLKMVRYFKVSLFLTTFLNILGIG